jgi:hypothetical protein
MSRGKNLERLAMTVNIEATASSMPESLDSLRTTPLVMHRIVFALNNSKQWYEIMREARSLYGKNWRCQPRVKRKLDRHKYMAQATLPVWFEVPDSTFATWVAVKHAVIANPVTAK